MKHSFGWIHPEYNLMSWALSCLSLMEHYDEVELYTDSAENLNTASYDISQSRTCNLEVGLFKIVWMVNYLISELKNVRLDVNFTCALEGTNLSIQNSSLSAAIVEENDDDEE